MPKGIPKNPHKKHRISRKQNNLMWASINQNPPLKPVDMSQFKITILEPAKDDPSLEYRTVHGIHYRGIQR